MKYIIPVLLSLLPACTGQLVDREYYKVTTEVLVGQNYAESLCNGTPACAMPLGDTCIVVVSMINDLVLLGHEFLHCLVGNFH